MTYSLVPYRFAIFCKKPEKIDTFFHRYHYFFDSIFFLSDTKRVVIVDSILPKEDVKELILMFTESVKIIAIDPPSLDELLEKISRKENLSLGEKKYLNNYSKQLVQKK